MIGRLALAAAALLATPAVSAQSADKPIAEAAADLAYGYCPLYLSGQFALTGNPALTGFGFADTVEKRSDARFGEMHAVVAKRADGVLSFGGVPDKVCTVVVMGPNRAAALAMLHKNMEYMGFAFKADAANTGDRGGLKLETFKAPVESQFINVQLIDASTAPQPAIIAQLFVTTE